jgi:hypothetical protein
LAQFTQHVSAYMAIIKTSNISCTKDGNEYVERIHCNRMLKQLYSPILSPVVCVVTALCEANLVTGP